jgi:polyketide biosynthesis acyl carrier protein
MTASRAEVFNIVKTNILEVLPDLDPAEIREDRSMRDMGANSIDRADVIVQTMEQLGIKFRISELAEVKNIGGLVDFLVQRTRA